jgi:hypothetical protein
MVFPCPIYQDVTCKPCFLVQKHLRNRHGEQNYHHHHHLSITITTIITTTITVTIFPLPSSSPPPSFHYHQHRGASVAKWLAHLPFTSEAAGSSLSENFLNATRTRSSCEKSKKSSLCRKSWVSSGYSGFLPQGKLTGWVR